MQNPLPTSRVSNRHVPPFDTIFYMRRRRCEPLKCGGRGHRQITLDCFPVKNWLLMMECGQKIRITQWRHPTNRRWVADRQNRHHARQDPGSRPVQRFIRSMINSPIVPHTLFLEDLSHRYHLYRHPRKPFPACTLH